MESVEWKMECYDYQHLMLFWTLKVIMHLLARHGNHNFPLYIFHSPLSTLPILRRNFNRTGRNFQTAYTFVCEARSSLLAFTKRSD